MAVGGWNGGGVGGGSGVGGGGAHRQHSHLEPQQSKSQLGQIQSPSLRAWQKEEKQVRMAVAARELEVGPWPPKSGTGRLMRD